MLPKLFCSIWSAVNLFFRRWVMRCGMHGASGRPEPRLWHFKKLAFELQKEPDLAKNRLTAEKLKELYDAGLAEVVFDPSQRLIVACFFLWWSKLAGVVEAGTLWVKGDPRDETKNFRRKLYGGKLLSERVFARCTYIARQRNLKAVMFTHIDYVARLALRCGWKEDAAGDCQALRALVRPDAPDPDQTSAGTITRFFYSW